MNFSILTILPAFDYIEKANNLNLSQERYWQLLLHMTEGISEIDDEKFFLSTDGKRNAKSELDATIEEIIKEKSLNNKSISCRFPARVRWIKKMLKIDYISKGSCEKYNAILNKLQPTSATIVFPSAHINSPASMFGHTFLRINSNFKSTLLSYAINYAADVDESKTNGLFFTFHGLTGGYKGLYSMSPYYDKLKEYRDSEQRDIWEYDLDLSKTEIIRMFEHIWELNGIYSDYYFFTENCSYNLLWLLEIARDTIDLKQYFTYHVSPLETLHAMQDEKLIINEYFRESKRTVLLKYENIIDKEDIHYVYDVITNNKLKIDIFRNDLKVQKEQKQYILEAGIELLEYYYMQSRISKEFYLKQFHFLTSLRSKLGSGSIIEHIIPPSPLLAHRQARISIGVEHKENKKNLLLGFRPVYHGLEDNSHGLLHGTQIEFLNSLFLVNKNKVKIKELTLLSIVSLSQISEFIKPFSWRTYFKWDRNYLNDNLYFKSGVGAGFSINHQYGYSYFMTDVFSYIHNSITGGIGTSVGFIYDKSKFYKTNIDITKQFYTNGYHQNLFKFSQSYSVTNNQQIKFKYEYKDNDLTSEPEHTYNVLFNYYF
ncbi:MAG: DUF4105 domain-containing protein [Campylobacterota bacterium]|nr:DUF4105 domain-containing protein [Campylobacterota bacterium]